MLRRTFIRGLFAAAVLTATDPTRFLTPSLRREWRGSALAHLHATYLTHCHGRRRPIVIEVGDELFDAAVEEMHVCQRFIPADEPSYAWRQVYFKGARLIAHGSGWHVKKVVTA